MEKLNIKVQIRKLGTLKRFRILKRVFHSYNLYKTGSLGALLAPTSRGFVLFIAFLPNYNFFLLFLDNLGDQLIGTPFHEILVVVRAFFTENKSTKIHALSQVTCAAEIRYFQTKFAI